jgi:hypothetical protein
MSTGTVILSSRVEPIDDQNPSQRPPEVRTSPLKTTLIYMIPSVKLFWSLLKVFILTKVLEKSGRGDLIRCCVLRDVGQRNL